MNRVETLHCPKCGDTAIESIDSYLGTCAGVVTMLADVRALSGHSSSGVFYSKPAFDGGGSTEIIWDSGKLVGYQCGSCMAPVTLEELVTRERFEGDQDRPKPGVDSAVFVEVAPGINGGRSVSLLIEDPTHREVGKIELVLDPDEGLSVSITRIDEAWVGPVNVTTH